MKKPYHFSLKNCFWLWMVIPLVFFSLNVQAQNKPVKQWEKTFAGDNHDIFKTIKETQDGGLILAGSSISPLMNGNQDLVEGYYLIKLDFQGNKIWEKDFGGKGYDNLSDVVQTSTGGYLVGGYSNSPISKDKSEGNKGAADFWVINLDKDGNKIWDKTFGGEWGDLLKAIVRTEDDSYILGGFSGGYPIFREEINKTENRVGFLLLKLDSNRSKIWEKIYGLSINDELIALKRTADKGFIMGGNTLPKGYWDTKNPHKGWYDVRIVNVSSEGDKLWDVQIGSRKDWEDLKTLQLAPVGGYFIAGNTQEIKGTKMVEFRREQGSYMRKEFVWGPKNYWIIKLNSKGKVLSKNILRRKEAKLAAIQQKEDGGFLVLENYGIIGFNANNGYLKDHESKLVKLNSNGKLLWELSITKNENKEVNFIQPTSDGGFILGGNAYTQNGKSDYWIVKFSR